MRTIENWDHVPLHIIEKYRECDFSGINFVFAESNFSNLMQMWGKCVKQTAGILRWMDRVHLLGHSEVGRVGKNTNPQKMREDTNICRGWSIERVRRRRRKGKAELDFAKAFFPLFEGACYRGGRRKCVRPCSTAFAFTWNARRWRRSTLHIVHYSLHIEHCTMHIALERPLSGLRLACWPDFETWCTSLELYNLSTSLPDPLSCNLFALKGAAVRRMHLALPRVETSGFGSGLDSASTSGLVSSKWTAVQSLYYKLLFSLL